MESNRIAKILIIDDDPASLITIEDLLHSQGYKTISTSIGSNAYSIAKSKQPDLILIDINLSGERGSEICKKLKKNPTTSEIPVLFLSVEADVASKIECFEAGGQDYITKPFEPHEMLLRIRTHLRLQQTQKALIKVLSSKINEVTKAQKILLPPNPSELPDAKFEVFFKQLSDAGGDFYDVLKNGDDIFDYITADICGHDLSCAFVTAALKSLFVQNNIPHLTPAEILNIVNKVIPSVLQNGQFICVTWIRINRLSKKALIVNAGQPPVIFLPLGKEGQKINITGDLIGVFENVIFEQIEIEIKSGDRFLLYSDGIVESNGKSPALRENALKQLICICNQTRDKPLKKFVIGLPAEMQISKKSIKDDIVILGIEV